MRVLTRLREVVADGLLQLAKAVRPQEPTTMSLPQETWRRLYAGVRAEEASAPMLTLEEMGHLHQILHEEADGAEEKLTLAERLRPHLRRVLMKS